MFLSCLIFYWLQSKSIHIEDFEWKHCELEWHLFDLIIHLYSEAGKLDLEEIPGTSKFSISLVAGKFDLEVNCPPPSHTFLAFWTKFNEKNDQWPSDKNLNLNESSRAEVKGVKKSRIGWIGWVQSAATSPGNRHWAGDNFEWERWCDMVKGVALVQWSE